MRSVFALLLGLAQASPPCPPVPAPGSPIRPECECRSVKQLLGPADAEPGLSRLLKRVRACPRLAAEALAGELRRSRALRDTAEWERRTWLTHYVIDSALVNAALELAQDGHAPPEARIYGLRTLIWQRAPGHTLSIREITAEHDTVRVQMSVSSYTSHYYTDRGYGDGSYPFPVFGRLPDSGYLARTTAALRALAKSPGLPEQLANATAYALALPPDRQLIALLDSIRKGP